MRLEIKGENNVLWRSHSVIKHNSYILLHNTFYYTISSLAVFLPNASKMHSLTCILKLN